MPQMYLNSLNPKLQGATISTMGARTLSPKMRVKSVYCCGLMYVTTAAYIVTYMHLMLLTAHLAYLAARYVVDGQSIIQFAHMVTGFVQAVLLGILYYGIKRSNFVFLRMALFGLIFKLLLAAAYLAVLISVQLRPLDLLKHLNEFPILRITVSLVYCAFVLFSVLTVHRCFRYYTAVRAVVRQKVDGSKRLYECCANHMHYANRYAPFARSHRNDTMSCIKFENEKTALGTICKPTHAPPSVFF